MRCIGKPNPPGGITITERPDSCEFSLNWTDSDYLPKENWPTTYYRIFRYDMHRQCIETPNLSMHTHTYSISVENIGIYSWKVAVLTKSVGEVNQTTRELFQSVGNLTNTQECLNGES